MPTQSESLNTHKTKNKNKTNLSKSSSSTPATKKKTSNKSVSFTLNSNPTSLFLLPAGRQAKREQKGRKFSGTSRTCGHACKGRAEPVRPYPPLSVPLHWNNNPVHTVSFTPNNNNKSKYNCHTKLGSGTFGIVIGCTVGMGLQSYASGTVKSQLLVHPKGVRNLDFRYESGVYDKSAPHGTPVPRNSNPAIAIKYMDISKISTGNPDKLVRAIANFDREKTIHSQLDHPNVVKYIAGISRDDIILDPGLNITPDNMHFFAMEYCDQGTLASYLIEHNGKSVARIDIICQIFAGLNYLFQVGIIHLDIKPQNILVAPGPMFKLADFGLAKQLKNRNKATIDQYLLKCGTMEYIPYFAENTTYFRDLYAFYCLLYYITTHNHLNSGKPVKPVTKRWSSMDTEPIRPNIFTDTEFSYLANIVQILAKLQTVILSILKKPTQLPSGARASKLANIKGILSFGSNSGSGSSSSSANNNINPKLVKQTQRRKLVLNRYDLYAGYYKMLDAELDVISKVHAKPSIVMPAPPRKKPVTISTELSGTKTKTAFENANNAGVAEQPLTPVKPRY